MTLLCSWISGAAARCLEQLEGGGWFTGGQASATVVLSAGFLGQFPSRSRHTVGLGFLTAWRPQHRQTSYMVTDWLPLRQKVQEVARLLKGPSTSRSGRVKKKGNRLLSL